MKALTYPCLLAASLLASLPVALLQSCGDKVKSSDEVPEKIVNSSDGKPNLDQGKDKGRDSSPNPSESRAVSDDELRSMAAAAGDSGQATGACRDILMGGIYNTHKEDITEGATSALRRTHPPYL